MHISVLVLRSVHGLRELVIGHVATPHDISHPFMGIPASR